MRKTLTVTITDEGRDKGKVFQLKEMPASQAEKWAARALFSLAKSGVDIPEGIENAGMAAMVQVGIKAIAGLSFEDAEPLMDEMFACITVKPDLNHPEVERPLIEDDIEEVATRVKLRIDLWNLHTGFSLGAALSKPSQPAQAAPAASSSTT